MIHPARDTTGLRGGLSETLRRPGLPGCFAGRDPAASDLAGIYEDVGTVLMTLSTSSVLSFRFSTSVSSGSAIKRYPNIHRRLSVRTEDLPAGLLHVGEPPLGFQGPTGSQHHLTMQRILASMKTCCGRAVWCARPLYDSKVAWEISHITGRKSQMIENRGNRDFGFAQWDEARDSNRMKIISFTGKTGYGGDDGPALKANLAHRYS